MRSRPWHKAAAPRLAVVAIAAALGSACTALVEFRDEPFTTGADATAPTSTATSSGTTPRPDGGPRDGGTTVDATPPPVDASPCIRPDGRALGSGVYCANNGTEPWPNSNDLITCNKGTHTYKPCKKCFKSGTGVPDVCDECAGRPDGKYCGDQMPITDDVTVEITCKGGVTLSTRECGNKCFNDGVNATECRL